MHDANNKRLHVGDICFIPVRITHLHPGDDYWNVDAETIHGRRPDGAKEPIGGINTAVLEKAQYYAGITLDQNLKVACD